MVGSDHPAGKTLVTILVPELWTEKRHGIGAGVPASLEFSGAGLLAARLGAQPEVQLTPELDEGQCPLQIWRDGLPVLTNAIQGGLRMYVRLRRSHQVLCRARWGYGNVGREKTLPGKRDRRRNRHRRNDAVASSLNPHRQDCDEHDSNSGPYPSDGEMRNKAAMQSGIDQHSDGYDNHDHGANGSYPAQESFLLPHVDADDNPQWGEHGQDVRSELGPRRRKEQQCHGGEDQQ